MEMTIRRRIAQIELFLKSSAPSREEMMAARERIGARATTRMRTAIELYCGLTRDEIDEEAGPPYLWRGENIEADEQELVGDTPEQEQTDHDIVEEYGRANGIPNDGPSDAEWETFEQQIMRILEHLTPHKATPQDNVSNLSEMLDESVDWSCG